MSVGLDRVQSKAGVRFGDHAAPWLGLDRVQSKAGVRFGDHAAPWRGARVPAPSPEQAGKTNHA